MTHASYSFFAEDKKQFIGSKRSLAETDDFVIAERDLIIRESDLEDELVVPKNYRFLAQNRSLMEHEFRNLFAILQKKGEARETHWSLCYYYCRMLEKYYQAYENTREQEKYATAAETIRTWCTAKPSVVDDEKLQQEQQSFLASLWQKFTDSVLDILSMPLHLSKMRTKIGLLNIYRIYWAFCRIALTNTLILMRDKGWIERLGTMLNKHIDVKKIIAVLEKPAEAFRAMSVAFFAIRFLFNFTMMFKHGLFPSEQEEILTTKERFLAEAKKRLPDFMNDIVWGTVNLLSNYAPALHIAAPVAGWLTGGFLFFDVALLLVRRQLAKNDYDIKKAQYQHELFELGYRGEQAALVHQQLKELEISWQTTSGTFLFNASAALLLASGFCASLLLGPGSGLLIAYVACVLAVAMYLSDAEYGQYKESKLRLQEARLDGRGDAQELEAYRAARNEFIYTLMKNAIIPGLLIATFAICWQAALVLTVVVLSYELWRAYTRYKANQPGQETPDERPDASNDAMLPEDHDEHVDGSPRPFSMSL